MRHDLEARYDHRLGTFDWDYAMNLCDIGVRKGCELCSNKKVYFRPAKVKIIIFLFSNTIMLWYSNVMQCYRQK